MFKKDKTYKDLYFRILEIGQNKLLTGISYNELYEQLKKEGFDCGNDCIDLAVRHYFVEGFFHIVDHKEFTGIQNLDDHKDCNFVLKGEAALKLMEYEKSKNNLLITKIVLIISIISVIASIIQAEIAVHNLKQAKEAVEKSIVSNPNP